MLARSLSKSAQRVQDALVRFGVSLQVQELPDSTRSAEDAARAIGCEVGNIVKSLLFRTVKDKTPILVLASGTNQVNLAAVGEHIREEVEKMDAKTVKAVTGFVIGGVPPAGHTQKITTYIDADLIEKTNLLWAAAGTPNAVFSLTPSELQTITDGEVINIKEYQAPSFGLGM